MFGQLPRGLVLAGDVACWSRDIRASAVLGCSIAASHQTQTCAMAASTAVIDGLMNRWTSLRAHLHKASAFADVLPPAWLFAVAVLWDASA